MKARKLTMGMAAMALVLAACSDSSNSDSDRSSEPQDADDIVAAIENPTGTVRPDTARAVGKAYQRALDVEPRRSAKSASGSFDFSGECSDGGSVSSSGEVDDSHGELSVAFDECCLDTCCKNGSFKAYGDRVQVDADDGGVVSYSGCVSYDLSVTCESSSWHVEGEGCLDAQGKIIRVVSSGGETFTVAGSASFHDGEGELEIRGSNGTFSCTFERNGSGVCTGETSFRF